MRVLLFVICSLFVPGSLIEAAQPQVGTARVQVRAAAQPVEKAEVVVSGQTTLTDASGVAIVSAPAGAVEITVVKEGFAPITATVQLTAGAQQEVVVDLEVQPTVEEMVTVVASTRTDKRLEDQPMRVEVLAREEIEEKMLMTPGDIVMMLNEMGGMRVQATSPALGAASVRIQGMRGRYTRVLSDGLPLFGEVGGLGLLQIPPMDLGQVEVIKGVASALYGAGAMGGIVNLLSRRPAPEPEQEILVNRSTRGATDATAFLSAPLSSGWSATLLAGGHWQDIVDVDGDSWSDLAKYSRAVVRPRLFWDGGNGRSFFATGGWTYEDRNGGTLPGQTLPMTGEPYVESLQTRKFDVGASGQLLLANRYVLTMRVAAARQNHEHGFGEIIEDDTHDTAFGEVAMRGSTGRHTWVAGAAFERDGYRAESVPRFNYTFTIPGVFAQYDVDVTKAFSLSSSARLDVHGEYGTFLSPRISALLRAGSWSSRLSIGTGFFGSTPITEETEAAGLTRLTLGNPLKAERGVSTSIDVTRTDGPLSYTATIFTSRINDALHVERSPQYVLSNLTGPTTNRGGELLMTLRHEPFSLTGTYTYVHARETIAQQQQIVPLTPAHSAGVVGMWEKEDVGRVGVELYFTGRQQLEENPYRTESEPYFILGLLAEKQFGPLRLFINGENLTGVRQSRWDPLLRPDRAADGRWTVDAWAPLEGRTVNGGIRLRF
jgi:outer membrane receptor for ferrienterochelin and colicins